jgi:hypothetical protein
MGGQDLGDAAIETLHHSVGFGRAWLDQTMLDTHGLAELIELVPARGRARLGATQPIRELLAVVGEKRCDPGSRPDARPSGKPWPP